MKELEYCSECDCQLGESDKIRNRDWRVKIEEWTCGSCWDWEERE